MYCCVTYSMGNITPLVCKKRSQWLSFVLPTLALESGVRQSISFILYPCTLHTLILMSKASSS